MSMSITGARTRSNRRRAAAIAVLATTALAGPVAPAHAADGCGSNWHQESRGQLTKYKTVSYDGNRSLSVDHSGRLRFCTYERTFADDTNRKVIIGLNDSDGLGLLRSQMLAGGKFKAGSLCLKVQVQVRLENVEKGTTATTSTEFGTEGFSVSSSSTTSTGPRTITATWRHCNSGDLNQIKLAAEGLTVTGPQSYSEVAWVRVTSTASGTYTYLNAEHPVSMVVDEYDYPA